MNQDDYHHWHSALGREIVNFSHAINTVARSPFSVTPARRDAVNDTLKTMDPSAETYNIARLPDELSLATLQTAGGCIHSIGNLLCIRAAHPVALSSLARTAVENSAITIYLNTSEDDVTRTLMANNVLRRGLLEAGHKNRESKFNSSLVAHDALNERASRERIRHVPKLPSSYTGLIAQTLAEIDGQTLYNELNRFTHPNAETLLTATVSADLRPHINFRDSFKIAVRSAGCAIVAAKELSKYRETSIDPSFRHFARIMNLDTAFNAEFGE